MRMLFGNPLGDPPGHRQSAKHGADAPRSPFLPATRCLILLLAAGCEPPIPQVDGIEVTLTEANFAEEVLQAEHPVLVDFGATWCGPCRKMEPIVALVSLDYEHRLSVGKVDEKANRPLLEEYQIRGFPTFVLFRDGREVDRRVGAMSHRTLTSWLDATL